MNINRQIERQATECESKDEGTGEENILFNLSSTNLFIEVPVQENPIVICAGCYHQSQVEL